MAWRRGPVVIQGPLKAERSWWLIPVVPAVIGGLLYVGVESAASLTEWALKRFGGGSVAASGPILPRPAGGPVYRRPGYALRTRPRLAAVPSVAPARSARGVAADAVIHWNSGIIHFQKGDYEKARDEWKLCAMLDPANGDCLTGLQRIEQQYGAP